MLSDAPNPDEKNRVKLGQRKEMVSLWRHFVIRRIYSPAFQQSVNIRLRR
jgi:hypothetical protein